MNAPGVLKILIPFFAKLESIESIPVPHLEITFSFFALARTLSENSSSLHITPSYLWITFINSFSLTEGFLIILSILILFLINTFLYFLKLNSYDSWKLEHS